MMNMYYVDVPIYANAKHSISKRVGENTYSFATLDEARKFAIECLKHGQWEHMSAYVSQAFFPNTDVMKFIGGGVKGISIRNTANKEENFYGGVVPNRGKFYWVLNNAQHRKFLLNMYGQVIELPSKDDWHPFGL